jgi:hypothetical protein
MMQIPDIVLRTSQAFNRVLFGAGVASDGDFYSVWSTVSTAYIANLLVLFVPIGIVSTIVGYYDPFHAPFETSNIRVPLIAANLAAFVATYVASLTWTVNDQAIERMQRVNRTIWEYYVYMSLSYVLSIFTTTALFIVPGYTTLLASTCFNSLLLVMLLIHRRLKSLTRE